MVDHVCSPLGSDICIWIMPHAYYTNLLSGHFVVFGFPYLRNLLVYRKFGPSLEAKTDKWAVIIKKLRRFKTPDLLIIDFLLLHPEWTMYSLRRLGSWKKLCFSAQKVSRLVIGWVCITFGQEKNMVVWKGVFLKTARKNWRLPDSLYRSCAVTLVSMSCMYIVVSYHCVYLVAHVLLTFHW